MAEDDNAFIRQIDEEMRREQLAKLWQQYGTYMIAAAALIVVGVGGWKWYEARAIASAQAAGARYEAVTELVQSGKTAEADKDFQAIAKDGPAGYATLARFQLAAAAAKAGRKDEAVATLDGLSNDAHVDPLLSGYARLQAAQLKLGTAGWTEMQNRLNPLLGDSSAWRYSAREALGLAAYHAGMLDEARKSFEQLLADRKVPPSIAERSKIAMGMIVAVELTKAGAAAQPKTEGAATGGKPADAVNN
jgi:hypothetical protein